MELTDIHWVTQTLKHLCIILKRCRQLLTNLILIRDKFSALTPVFVDVLHTIAPQIEAHAEIFRTEYIMQIGYLGKLLGYQSAIKCIQSSHTMILMFHIGFHEVDIRSQIIEKRTRKFPAEHCDANIRILGSQSPYHRYSHGHIA